MRGKSEENTRKVVNEAHHRQLPSNNRGELQTPHMAVFATVIVVAGNRYHEVRTAETNSAVVEAHGGDAAVRRTRPAKFTAMVEKR